MAGVIWGFHRDGNIGRFLITNVLWINLSPNVIGFFKDTEGFAYMYDIHASFVGCLHMYKTIFQRYLLHP